tara:strand:- start:4192 stop:4419 length:228 start_codon:yes stop_codon:yes gene_type:complete
MDEEQKYWDDMRDMMLTAGWKALVEELTNNAEAVDSVLQAKDEADLHFRKGQLNILTSIINLENSVEQAEAQAND